MDDESVDVVVTSPPYNIGVAYRSYDDKRPKRSYLDWLQGPFDRRSRPCEWLSASRLTAPHGL